jgi:O-antigen/teichoic acid export membrane protein
MTLYLVVLAHRFGLPVRPAIGLSRLRAMWRYAAGTYLATAIIMVPNLLMPVLVAQRVDPAHAAYYYIASLVASVLGFVPQAVSRSLFAELAAEPAPDPETARAHLLRVLRLTVVGQLPILALLLLCGRPVLGLFSPVYADAYPLLVLLALTGVASSVSFVGSTLLLADGRLRLLCQLSAVSCAVALLGAYLLGGRGLVWVGWSLLAAEGVLAVGYLRVIAGRLRAPRREVTPCG